jgi:hypothetical protein
MDKNYVSQTDITLGFSVVFMRNITSPQIEPRSRAVMSAVKTVPLLNFGFNLNDFFIFGQICIFEFAINKLI